jgi:hypothetical protein
MVSSFVIAVGFFVAGKMDMNIAPHVSLVITVAATTIVWITVTLMTRPADRSKSARVLSAGSTRGSRLAADSSRGWRERLA